MMLLRDNAKVQRYVNKRDKTTGTITKQLGTIIDNLPCYLEPDDGVVVVPPEGQTAIYYINMYCNVDADLKANDIVTDIATGEIFKVINVRPFNILPHIEARLQGGTIK